MVLGIEELLERSQSLRRQRKYEEALVYANYAVREDEFNEVAWYQVAINREHLGDINRAIEAYQRTVDLDDSATEAWIRLGQLFIRIGEIEQAKSAYEAALIYEHNNEKAITGMVSVLAQLDDEDEIENELSLLEQLDNIRGLTSTEINRKGIIYFRQEQFQRAIACWKLGENLSEAPELGFNLGLAYNQDSISQDADAIDYWRLVLSKWPNYQPAKKRIEAVLPRLLHLAKQAQENNIQEFPKDEWYTIYINPFQLIIQSSTENPAEFDLKKIQQLKKRLLQEIDLEEGYISWIPGLQIDRSRAIAVCEELNDEKKRKWHLIIFNNKPLLSFLNTGAIEHFLVNQDRSEIETISELHSDSEFRTWLSVYFCNQFDRRLSLAIEKRNIIHIECMLDGRRWVEESLEDRCFVNAKKALNHLISPLNNLLQTSEEIKPQASTIAEILDYSGFIEIFNLLPVFFEEEQNTAISKIRNLAVNVFNKHDDAELSKLILEYTKKFKFRSKSITNKVNEDIEAIEKIIQDEKQSESHFISGHSKISITKKGIRHGDVFFNTEDIESIKYGIDFEDKSKIFKFTLEIANSNNNKIQLTFKCNKEKFDESKKIFDKLLESTITYVIPEILKKVVEKINNGISINFGPFKINRNGIFHVVEGWIFTREYFIPWEDAIVRFDNGKLIVFNQRTPSKKSYEYISKVENAIILSILSNNNK